MTAPVFGVAGWKNSGKTTLMTKLIAEFKARGLSVAAIKHAHHSFDVDHEGRDSFRFREAGAERIIVSSPVRWAMMTELRDAPEPVLQELLAQTGAADIILVEGFKASPHAKIEVRRREAMRDTPLAPHDSSIKAIAADFDLTGETLPVFDLNSVPSIADFILATTGKDWL